MTVKLYLDTCIFIAYYFDHGSRKFFTQEALEKLKKNNKTTLVTSDFTFTEFTKAAQTIDCVNTEEYAQ